MCSVPNAVPHVATVEHLVLLVDRRLGAVEVLRPVVIVEQLARPESDDIATQIPDRPDEPTAEAVVDPTVALADEAARHQLGIGEALDPQVTGQCIPGLRREPNAEVRSGRCVEASRREEVAAHLGALGGELLDVERRGDLVRLDEPGALALLPVDRRSPVDIPQLDARALGQLLDRLGEAQVVDLL